MRTFDSAVLAAALTLVAAPGGAQTIRRIPQTQASFRGLSVVDSAVVWVSGTGGTYAWTDDAGGAWHVGTVPGAASLDFRDVHAVSLDTAYLMVSAQDTGRIYKTVDRGAHWALQYEDTRTGAFLDAIAFFDARHGIAIGDPIDGRFVVLRTEDGGAHWAPVAAASLPAALPGEAAFAASGTALVTRGARDAWFATGGARTARVFRTRDGGATWTVTGTPVAAGNQASGIFSLAFTDSLCGVAVGGNYSAPDPAATTVAYTADGGATWTAAAPSPATGYLSGVSYIPNSGGMKLVAVGTTGTAYSADAGKTWSRADATPFNSVGVAPNGLVWVVGENAAAAMLTDLPTGAGKRAP